jgi:hypothetical protein
MSEKEGPIQPELKESANAIAAVINEALNPDGKKTFGFALLMFKFGEAESADLMNYISNAAREDMLTAMKEFIARAEGHYHEPAPIAKQPPDPTKR